MFSELRELDVTAHCEKRGEFTYLSWAWAWDYFVQKCPDATYEVIKNPDGLPYFESEAGVMVYTKITAGGLTHEMWLPVMDGANNPMKAKPYQVTNRWNKTTDVAAFDMFDVNKAVMRCLVKNMAMFGLGLYIYAGEDLPPDDKAEKITDLIKQINAAPTPKIQYERWMDAKKLFKDSDEEATWWNGIQPTPRRQIKEYGQFLESKPEDQSLTDVLLGKEAA